MKVVCNKDDSKELCQIIHDFDKHYRQIYIKIDYIELETNCIEINGSDIITTGTRYVYEGEKLYTEIRRWYDSRLQKRRDEQLENIGI